MEQIILCIARWNSLVSVPSVAIPPATATARVEAQETHRKSTAELEAKTNRIENNLRISISAACGLALPTPVVHTTYQRCSQTAAFPH